ncbi:hypothetical protein BX591_107218 [Paraburkholderia bryophila]|uniref:Uncharacterized protein n=2 Tax=Paraburkholderia bryophila TaxID=420952 RepID=A0A329CHY5_9BURK|nr:hypothetical protein BX591_107218 [Paraburkholderia bryophila]
MRQSDGNGSKGPKPLNATSDPVFHPPTRRYDPGHGAVGSGRPRSLSAPLPIGVHSSGPVLSPMTPPPHSSPGRAATPPVDRAQNSAATLSPMRSAPSNRSGGAALTPMQHNPSSGSNSPVLSPMQHQPSGSQASGPRPDHVAIDLAPSQPLHSLAQPLVQQGGQQAVQPVLQPVAQQPANPETARQKVGKFAPLVDGLAAGASLVASRVVPGSVASTASGAVSGVLWGAAAGMSEAGNTQPASRLASFGNFMNFSAGALSTASVFNTDSTQTNLGYASSAAWGLSAITGMAHAALDGTRGRVSRGLQIASGVANLAAAGLSAASVRASSENDTTSAAWYGTASSLSWMAGAAFAYGSARTASNPSPRVVPALPSESSSLRSGSAGRSFGTIQSV